MRTALGVLVAIALSGCFDYSDSAVFGPAGASDAVDPGEPWTVSVKAKPAQGPAPLRVAFTIDVGGAPADMPWSIDFGDRSNLTGRGARATQEHVYVGEGRHDVFVTIGADANATRSTLAILVLPPTAPPHPEEEVEATPVPPPESPPAGGEPAPPAPDPSSNTTSTSSAATAGSQSVSQGPSSTPAGTPTRSTSSSASSTTATTGSPTASSPPPSSSPPSPSPSPTAPPPPSSSSASSAPSGNVPPETDLTFDASSNSAPTTVTYTIMVRDPDDGDVAWDFTVDGVELGSGQGDASRSFAQTYDAPGDHTAVLTAFDGITTVRRTLTITIP